MTTTRRVRFPIRREMPDRIPVSAEPADIVQDDYGRYRLGLADEGPGFESRRFAQAVAARTRWVLA